MRFFLSTFIAVLFSSVAYASSPASGQSVQAYQLRNGLKVLIKPDHRAPVAYISVWYKVGGSYEHNGITGISHMLEHMMFRGTKQHPPGEFKKIMSRIGASVNAFTSQDCTVYHEEVSVADLPMVLQLEADRMQHLVLDAPAFDKERDVVLEERRTRIEDNPISKTFFRFKAAALVNSPYRKPVIGWLPDIQSYELNDALRWYHDWYGPNNAVIIIAGDVDPDKVIGTIKRYFSAIPTKPTPVSKPRREITSLGERHVTLRLKAKTPYLYIGFNVPSLKTADKPWQPYALDLLRQVLSGGRSALLERSLVRDKAIALSSSANYDLVALHDVLFTLSGIPTESHTLHDLQLGLLKEVEQLQRKPLSVTELARVKQFVRSQYVYLQDSLSSQATALGFYEMAGLKWQQFDAYLAQMEAVTPEQIQAVAKQFLTSSNMTVATLIPEQQEN